MKSHDELLDRLVAVDAARPVPAGALITPTSLRRRERRRAARALCLATAAVTALGLPLLLRDRGAPPQPVSASRFDAAAELRVLAARLAVLQVQTADQQRQEALRQRRTAATEQARAQRFLLAGLRADAVLQHQQSTEFPESRR